jgi:hypothetical protein
MLNASKTSLHILHPPRVLVTNLLTLYLQDEQLVVSKTNLKWLGVEIDDCLSFVSFTQSKCNSAYNQLRMIRFLGKSLNHSSRRLLINALVVSRLAYCDSLLVEVPETQLNKVQRAWNLAAKTVVGARKYDHVTPILESLGWPLARQNAWLKVARLVFLSLHGCAPEYLQCAKTIPRRELRSGEDGAVLLSAEIPRKVIEKGRWEVVAAHVWNSLPAQLRVVGQQKLSNILRAVLLFSKDL